MCLRIFSIQWNIVAVIAVSLLAQTAHGQRRTTKKMSTTVSYKEDPMYVQKFVSRMMSKHPLKDEAVEEGVTGFSEGPNLGYVPYWYNLPDIPWKDKCARCSDLFKSYKTVCAVDSTGEVMVNISLCKMLQMNCLGGIVKGNSTGKNEDFGDDYFVVADGWARFAFRQDLNAVVQLSTTPDLEYPKYTVQGFKYQGSDGKIHATRIRFDSSVGSYDRTRRVRVMAIDGWNGWWSGMYRNNRIWEWYHTLRYKALAGKDNWAEFVIYWNSTSGWLLMTRSDYPNWIYNFHFNTTDDNPFPIKYIALGGTQGYTGEWIIKGFIVTQLSPCASMVQALARPVPTSPTEVPGIMSRLSPANIGFYSRVDYAGVQHENVSFLTREEY